MAEVAVLALRSFAFGWLCLCLFVCVYVCVCLFCLVWPAVLVISVRGGALLRGFFCDSDLGWNSSSACDGWVGCVDRSVWVVERFWMSMGGLSIPCFWVRFCEVDPSFEIYGRILKLSLTSVTTRRGLLVIFVAVGLKCYWEFGLTSCSFLFPKVFETRFMTSTLVFAICIEI